MESGRLRIDDLAAKTGIAVGTIRFYQREGLIPPPEREGRIGWYPGAVLADLERIRALQGQGLPLAVIGDLLRREREGAESAPWLQSAVFGPRSGERMSTAWMHSVGLAEADVEGLVAAGLLTRRDDGDLDALPGVAAMTREMIEAGVSPQAFRDGAGRVAARLRSVAEALAELGWTLFEADRARVEDDPAAVAETLVQLERMQEVARRMVATLFPALLDEVVRARIEAYLLERATENADTPAGAE